MCVCDAFFRRLNEELEAKTANLVREAEEIMVYTKCSYFYMAEYQQIFIK